MNECEFLFGERKECLLFQLGKGHYKPYCVDNINCKLKMLEKSLIIAYLEYGIDIKAHKTIGIEHYYLPQTIACEALKQLGEYEEEYTTDEYK